MKKIAAFLAMIMIILCCSSCTTNTAYYKERLNDYKRIATYIENNYELAEADSGTTVNFNEIISDEKALCDSLVVAGEKFTYALLEPHDVLFWNDETQTLGLMYTDDSETAIAALKAWYTGVNVKKINDNWYLVGKV